MNQSKHDVVCQDLCRICRHRATHIDGGVRRHPSLRHLLYARHDLEERGEAESYQVHVITAHLIASAERIDAPQCLAHHMRALHMDEDILVDIRIVSPNQTGMFG